MSDDVPTATPETTNTFKESCDFSPSAKKWTVKILLIIIALLVFQIPLSMIKHLVNERGKKAAGVHAEIAKSWGEMQNIGLFPAAAKEDISVTVTPEVRYRGIYQAVVYSSEIKISREFENIAAGTAGEIKLPSLKSLDKVSVSINGKEVLAKIADNTLTFALPAGNTAVDVNLKLRGSSGIKVMPNAGQSNIVIAGKWQSPSFVGDSLPSQRSIDKDSFRGEWHFNSVNVPENPVGVDLCISAGTYQQVDRCFTYVTFFLIVFFFTIFAAEMLTKINVHPLQYLVASGAPVLFYLMTLSFSEKIGFVAGYAVSAAIIVAMVSVYAKMFLGKLIPALLVGVVFAASYLLKFILLRMEDFALLSGTVILAVILGVLMVMTGKINHNQES